jgi:hypothetical protein
MRVSQGRFQPANKIAAPPPAPPTHWVARQHFMWHHVVSVRPKSLPIKTAGCEKKAFFFEKKEPKNFCP